MLTAYMLRSTGSTIAMNWLCFRRVGIPCQAAERQIATLCPATVAEILVDAICTVPSAVSTRVMPATFAISHGSSWPFVWTKGEAKAMQEHGPPRHPSFRTEGFSQHLLQGKLSRIPKVRVGSHQPHSAAHELYLVTCAWMINCVDTPYEQSKITFAIFDHVLLIA